MRQIKTVASIHREQERLGFQIDEFLRRRGWKYTCDTPGCFWLWERKFGERTILVSRDMAVAIEQGVSA